MKLLNKLKELGYKYTPFWNTYEPFMVLIGAGMFVVVMMAIAQYGGV